jgi:hypothetical protein
MGMLAKHKVSRTARALGMRSDISFEAKLINVPKRAEYRIAQYYRRPVPGRKGLGWILIVTARVAMPPRKRTVTSKAVNFFVKTEICVDS